MISQQLQDHLETRFTSYELAKIKYFYLCILYEGSKFIIMYIVFSMLQLRQEYLFALLILLSVRNTSGGIHLKRYTSCLLFTFLFLLGAIVISHIQVPANEVQDVLLLIAVPIAYYIGPITSDNRPRLSYEQWAGSRLVTCAILTAYILLFLCKETFIYRNLCFWVIVFQIGQLIAAKIIKERRVE